MKTLVRVVFFLGCITWMSESGWSQAAPAYAATPVSAPVDTAKQIATMETKLADWPQLGRYKA
jgi:hypothetical protein